MKIQKFTKILILLFILLFSEIKAQDVLIVADEIPAMEVLAKFLKNEEGLNSKIIVQSELPNSITAFKAVIVYIHKDLAVIPEKAFIDYALNGGKLILLHHSISSAKRKNELWFPFMGIDLPKKEASLEAYKYLGNVDIDVVNLAPKHFITTHKINYSQKIPYTKEGKKKGKQIDGFSLKNTEAYINHTFLSPRTILMGFKINDETGKTLMQNRSAWCMNVGKGWLFYSQPGHTISDFENPTYSRIIANALIFNPNN
ncbi:MULTISPECIES: ThuA domain-containing protein [unclassified Arcicella]|uniref:ThuA domain-containing protein n=1 Tax=unclassified Arcicella TaxID=2644986 RepID=UPI00285DB433|nr:MULTISPECIES: ThuA domain-containing protein [unclassified Arcicella]MDR6562300.1 hypothetical protein [Arcicella sp. BE51]MDR6812005.1 hypothetical protein [Arcicella sp. BE140]MDR6823316.1 hypothetical protein [Arcicella sp. BE139]